MRLIDADALKLYIDKEVEEDKVLDGWAFFFKTYLDNAPTIDRLQGKWICKGDWAECSLCGADSGTIMDGLERVPRYTRFCPECGARMKGADDEVLRQL